MRTRPPATVRPPTEGVATPTPAHRTVDDALATVDVAALTARVVAAADASTTTTEVPFTGTPLATLPQSSPEDVRRAVASARAAQRAWARRPVVERVAVLWRLYDLVLAHREPGMDLVQLESGKARADAAEEIVDVTITAAWYARHGPDVLADTAHRGLLPGAAAVCEVRHPKGVVGIIAPWNYPVTLAICDALPALLAGNAVVLKPDTQTALTALWSARLLTAAGLPDEVFQVVVGDGPVVGSALVDSVDHVCFTGSTETGRQVAQQAAGRLVGCSLELGGKNSLYVADDADLDRAAEAAVRDCFTSAGQLCVSMERLLLHHEIADAFLARFLGRVEQLRLGPALDFSVDVGCLVSDAQVERVARHVDDAVDRGAQVLTGGHTRPDVGPRFFAPTVLAEVPVDARCYGEETFGPVVAVHRVRGDDQAVGIANDTPYGLTASVWSADPGRADAVARRLRTGSVNVNEAYGTSWSAISAPIGGRGDSGLGRRHGVQGLLRFVESQTIARQRVGLDRLYALEPELTLHALFAVLRLARRARLPWP
jgi:succinate-semialdehyde dehydrogenase/glutarate-semialdehyde dehydrogenase